MKITKTPEGKIALILEPTEVSTLIEAAGFLALRDSTPSAPNEDKFKKLRKNTKSLLKDLRTKFGGSIISRKDPVFNDLLFKNKIVSHTQCLLTLEKKGIVTILKDGKNIDSFQLVA